MSAIGQRYYKMLLYNVLLNSLRITYFEQKIVWFVPRVLLKEVL